MPNINPIVLKTVSGGGGGGINYTVDVFTSSGTYTKPANLDYAYVLMVSGGGGGGSGRRGAASSNRGGGVSYNGGMMLSKWLNADLAATESVTIGAAGVGADGITTDNTNGLAGSNGGDTSFVSSNFKIVGGSSAAGASFAWTSSSGAVITCVTSENRKSIISGHFNNFALGRSTINDSFRGNTALNLSNITPKNSTSIGGGIGSTNIRYNAGILAGFYNDSNVLTGEISGTAPETNGIQPTEFYTFGQFLAKLFPWFDPADANYNIGRGGLGGGCGDLAGTIAGGNGADALGYGGGGGGGGASTNGANSGAGGNGSPGIVIIINVLTS